MKSPQCPECGLVLHEHHRCGVPRLLRELTIDLTSQERRYIRWLASADYETVDTFAGLFQRLREQEQCLRDVLHSIHVLACKSASDCEDEGAATYKGTDEPTCWYAAFKTIIKQARQALGLKVVAD